MSNNAAGFSARLVVRYWLPLVVWLGVIAMESTPVASSANTRHLLLAALNWLFGTANSAWIDALNFALRKSGHFLGYGWLGVLFFRALCASSRAAAGALAACAVGLTLVVASLDEFHQSFIPSRTGSVRDVLLDTVGAACLLSIVLAYLHLRQKSWHLAA